MLIAFPNSGVAQPSVPTPGVEAKPNLARGQDFEVVISEAQPLRDKDGTAKGFAITYRYEFRNETAVELDGVGRIPAKGEFSYVTSDQKLTFKPVSGVSPVTVDIKATRRSEGGGGLLEMPTETDFGSAALNETRTAAANFFESVSRLFNREFLSGYRVNQVGGTNQYVTTFRAIQGAPDNLRAEIAVMVSHSTAASAPPVPFRLQYLVRQKPKRSEKWDYSQLGLEQQVQPFVMGLLAKLKSE